ncbi:MAG: hypothetical protein AAFR27_06150 [Pseudomonadota bacterium]
MNFSPMEANPADLRFAVQTPEYIRVREGDVRMRLTYEASDIANSLVEEYSVVVQEVGQPTQGLPATAGDDSRLLAGQLTPEDAASLFEAQQRIRDLRAAGDGGKGSLAITATGCATRAVPAEPVSVTVWLQTNPEEEFFVVTRNRDLRKTVARANQNLDDIERC